MNQRLPSSRSSYLRNYTRAARNAIPPIWYLFLRLSHLLSDERPKETSYRVGIWRKGVRAAVSGPGEENRKHETLEEGRAVDQLVLRVRWLANVMTNRMAKMKNSSLNRPAAAIAAALKPWSQANMAANRNMSAQ